MTPEQIKMLQAPLDPKNVRKPDGKFGAKGDYIEGWHAIAEANRIFGHDGWSYTIDLIRDDAREIEKNGNPQWQVAYSCICTVTVGNVVRQDVGFGSGFAKNIGDAIEGATKEAATDALKRALRTFGHPFGLALYDKTREHVQAPPVAMITDEQRDNIAGLAAAAGVDLGKVCATAKVSNLKDLPADKYDSVVKKLNLTIDENAKRKAA